MTETPQDGRSIRLTARALLALFPAQGMMSLTALTLPVLATIFAADTGLPASWIGYYSSIGTVASMIAALCSTPFLLQLGPIRATQVMVLLAGAGALVLILAQTPGLTLAACVLSAILIGCANGPANMAGSDLLNRVTPLRLRYFVFSFKQASVPLGGAIGGALLPLISGVSGWPVACAGVAGFCCALALAMQPLRKTLDAERRTGARGGVLSAVRDLAAPMRLIFANPHMRWLMLTAATLSMAQFVFTSFFVTFLVTGVGLGVHLAASLFSIALAVGIFTRLSWGWVADRTSAVSVMGVMAIGTGLLCVLVTTVSIAWPVPLIGLIGIAFATMSASWNGVYLAEVARQAPDGQVAPVTACGMICLWCGSLLGPSIFSALIALTGGTDAGYLVVAACTLGSGANLLLRRRLRGATA